MEVRYRKNKTSRKDTSGVVSGPQKLVKELENLWERTSEEGVTRQQYDDYVSSLVASRKPALKWKKRRTCLRLFDCIWTIVLFIAAIILLPIFSPSFKSFLFSNVHPHLYSANRLMRFSFLAVHPYLLLAGLDFTNLCLVRNPLANDTMHCPCIDQPGPVTLHVNQKPLSKTLLEDSTSIYVLKNAVPIDKNYGRETLVQYFNENGELPKLCFETGSRPVDKSINYFELLNDSYWDEEKTSEPWLYVWRECSEGFSIRKLLPKYQFLFKDHSVTEDPFPHYWLATQWANSYEYTDNKHRNRNMFLVLQGTVRIRFDVSNIPCTQYCFPMYNPLVLSAGDALLYSQQHWFYTARTWSDTSFAVSVSLNVNT